MKIEDLHINMKVRFVDDSKRMELDGDGIYTVVGIDGGFEMSTGLIQKEKVFLMCDNGVQDADSIDIILA